MENIRTTIHRPTLTEAERAQRQKVIQQAAVDLVLAAERQKAINLRK